MALLRRRGNTSRPAWSPAAAARDAAVLDSWIARAGPRRRAGQGFGGGRRSKGGGPAHLRERGFCRFTRRHWGWAWGAALLNQIGFGGHPVCAGRGRHCREFPRLANMTRADVVLALALHRSAMLAPAITVALTAVHYLWLVPSPPAGALAEF